MVNLFGVEILGGLVYGRSDRRISGISKEEYSD